MKPISILLIFFITIFAMKVDYSYLQKSKNDYKNQTTKLRSIKKQPKYSADNSTYANYIKIMYKNPSTTDIKYLKKTYNLDLYKCIAKKSICIFVYKGNLPIESLILTIKIREHDIKVVEKYKKYNFKTF